MENQYNILDIVAIEDRDVCRLLTVHEFIDRFHIFYHHDDT